MCRSLSLLAAHPAMCDAGGEGKRSLLSWSVEDDG